VLYGLFTLTLHPGTQATFVLLVTAMVALANVLGDRQEQVRVGVMKQLGLGQLPMRREHLMLALSEAARVPETVFWVNLLWWVAGALVVGGLYGLMAGVPRDASSRVVYIGV